MHQHWSSEHQLDGTMGSENGETQIYDAAMECQRSFDGLMALNTPTTTNGHQCTTVQDHQQRFSFWIGMTGALAAREASLDRRLMHASDIRDLVLQMLRMLRRNTERCIICTRDDLKSLASVSPAMQVSLDGMKESLDRLKRLATAIRNFSASDLASKLKAFAQKNPEDNEEFERLTRLHIQGLHPKMPSSLTDQLVASICYRRLRLLYQKYYQRKLDVGRKGKQDVTTCPQTLQHLAVPQAGFVEQSAETDHTQRDQDFPKKPLPAAINDSIMSTTNVSQAQSENIRQHLTEPPSSSALSSSNMPSIHEELPCPKPPSFPQGAAQFQCTWCFEVFPVSKLDDLYWWRKHFEEDIEPYVCISEECTESLIYFCSLEDWLCHMKQAHTNLWTQEIHKTTRWFCNVNPGEKLGFTEPEAFKNHLSTAHRDQEFTASQVNSKVRRNVVVSHRPANECPICAEMINTSMTRWDNVGAKDSTQNYNQRSFSQQAQHAYFEVPGVQTEAEEEIGFEDSEDEFVGNVADRIARTHLQNHIAAHIKDLSGLSFQLMDEGSSADSIARYGATNMQTVDHFIPIQSPSSQWNDSAYSMLCTPTAFHHKGFNTDQWGELCARSAAAPHSVQGGDRERWYQIWDILFPGTDRPSSIYTKSAFRVQLDTALQKYEAENATKFKRDDTPPLYILSNQSHEVQQPQVLEFDVALNVQRLYVGARLWVVLPRTQQHAVHGRDEAQVDEGTEARHGHEGVEDGVLRFSLAHEQPGGALGFDLARVDDEGFHADGAAVFLGRRRGIGVLVVRRRRPSHTNDVVGRPRGRGDVHGLVEPKQRDGLGGEDDASDGGGLGRGLADGGQRSSSYR
ncbi:hypothetical protein PG985_010907 [Apiospora marii]|uniref:uncharacterized protein n=1 Tax=Apiospora marii TaxID=335849 RepID=UPI00312EB045